MSNATHGVVETARYKVFLNKTDKHVIVLQFPHLRRDQSFSEELRNEPLEIRIKPKNGLVELDVPLPDVSNINQENAVRYGAAVRQHKAATNDAPVGLAGGFGATTNTRVKRQEIGEERQDVLVADFANSLRLGKAMNYLTLTGQIKPFDLAEPVYYLGSFHGQELHLTRIAAFCSMNVGLHHLDAVDQNEKASKRAILEEGAPPEKAAIVGMQVKNAEELKTEESEWKKLLRELQEEPWQKLEWIDESDEQSYEIFHERLFLNDTQKSTRIYAVMSQEQYADSLSALRCFSVHAPNNNKKHEVLSKIYYPGSSDEEEDMQS